MKKNEATKNLWLELISQNPNETKILQLVKEGAQIKGSFLIELLTLIYPSESNLNTPKRVELNIVSLLIQLGAEVNYNEGGITALRKACETYNPELVELLLRSGANPNSLNRNNQSILEWAKSLLEMERKIYRRGLEVLLERIIEVLESAGAKTHSGNF